MMTSAAQENARMLASLLGVDEDEAAEQLNRVVLITTAASASEVGAEVATLLERTIHVTFNKKNRIDLELVLGETEPLTRGPHLFAHVTHGSVTINTEASPLSESNTENVHPLLIAIAACHVAAATLQRVIGSSSLPHMELPLVIEFAALGIPPGSLEVEHDLTGAVLIGGGAVGNGFLRALRHLRTLGILKIVDPKTVGEGNPNRCLYYTSGDVALPKAPTLAERAQADFASLELEPYVGTFAELVAKFGPIDTVIVTVDSRRARRSIQKEIPRRVIDASTTDARAIIVHSHAQPTDGACLACIYRHVPDELARERSIARGLGIDVETVKEAFISAEAAAHIMAAHPTIDGASIVGKAFDTLFKELCSTQALLTAEGRQVLAPFAFVSALAGALQVVELLRSNMEAAPTNYWSVDPWGTPIARLRRSRPRAPDCEFCANDEALEVVHALWGGSR